MKKENDFERKAQQAMESLDSFAGAEVPAHLEKKMLDGIARARNESSRSGKWMWAAAAALFLINGIVAYRYIASGDETTSVKSGTTTATTTDGIKNIGSYYFTGGSSIYE